MQSSSALIALTLHMVSLQRHRSGLPGLTAHPGIQQGCVGCTGHIQCGSHWWHTNQNHLLSPQLQTDSLYCLTAFICCLTLFYLWQTTPHQEHISGHRESLAVPFMADEGVSSWWNRIFFPQFTLASQGAFMQMGRRGIINKYVNKGRSILWLHCNFHLPEKKPRKISEKNP